jgi:hypothetical protein
MATREKQPVMTKGHPIFEWRPGVPVLDEDQVEGEDHEDHEMENGEMYDDGSDDEEHIDEDSDGESIHDDQSDDDAVNENTDVPDETDDDVNNDNDTNESNTDDSDDDRGGFLATEGNVDANDVSTAHQQQEPRSDGRPSRSLEATRRKHYAPRSKGESYKMQFVSVPESEQASWTDNCYRIAVDIMFTQMTATKGIKLFGERAVAVMFKEYTQMNVMVFGCIDPNKLTSQHKREAQRAVNLIKEKRCGRLKGRACADGRKQQAYIPR